MLRHMTVNLVTNVHKALEWFPLTTDIQCWLDSTVALHWLRDQGEYRQFITNRVRKIQSHPNTQWRHVPSTENPADLCSRGGSVTDVQLWWRGPEWLAGLTSWPEDIVTQQRKVQREILAADIKISDNLDCVLETFALHKTLMGYTFHSQLPAPFGDDPRPPVDTGNHHMQALLD